MTSKVETLKEVMEQYYGDIIKNVNNSIEDEYIVVEDGGLSIFIDLMNAGFDKDTPESIPVIFEKYDYTKDNEDMKYYPRRGFQMGDYCEFLISYSPLIDDKISYHVEIGNVQVRFGEPSKIFKFLFNHLIYDKGRSWDEFKTVSLDYIKEEDIEIVLEQSMYYLARIYPSKKNDYPEVYTYYGESMFEDNIFDSNENNQLNYQRHKYDEVFILYNEGRRKKDSLSFYRVLEYFFIINRKNEFELLINQFQSSDDLDRLIFDITKIFAKNEEKLLFYLLSNFKTSDIIDQAFNKGLIHDKTVENFTKKLYSFRNSIVHSKKEASNDFVLPSSITLGVNHLWIPILEKLARRCIHTFCSFD